MSNSRRVLIIEDHDDSRRLLVRLLSRSGFDVKSYDRCAPAERHLETGDIDIALLDVRLPGRCGDDFGKELRRRFPRTLIVFLTAEAAFEPLKKAVADCHIVPKPVDMDLLLGLLSRLEEKKD